MSSHREGIGQDKDLISLKRRSYLRTILVIVGLFLALLLALYITNERPGKLLVNADHMGAAVVINGSVTRNPVGKLINKLRADTYRISVSLDGYTPEPREQVVKIESGRTSQLAFKLNLTPPDTTSNRLSQTKTSVVKKEIILPKSSNNVHQDIEKALIETEVKKAPVPAIPPVVILTPKEEKRPIGGILQVATSPVEGSIFVDDEFRGVGKIDLDSMNFGEVVVKFGEMQGYKTPSPQKVLLTSVSRKATVEGIYLPLIFIAAHVDASGRTNTQKCDLKLGYAFADGDFQPDNVAGPAVKFLDEVHAFSWELGYAFSNRNPPGQDAIELAFNLPPRFDGNKPLELRLYGYASEKKYPFAVSSRVSLDVLVNGNPVQKDIIPTTKLTASAAVGYNSIAINNSLKVGQNTVRIQSSSSSHCFYYLTKIAIL
jgi:hypothetical protein